MLISVNGQPTDETTKLSGLDRGFLFGDGLFETLRIYSGKPFKLEQHLERLRSGAGRIEIDFPDDLKSVLLGESERASAAGINDGFLRITLSRGAGLGLGQQPEKPTLVTLIDALPHLDPAWYSRGIAVVVAEGRRNEFASTAGLKTIAYLDSIVAFRAAAAVGVDDALFLDTEGHLSEATASNIFVVADGVLRTPPLRCGALPGITRSVVVDIANTLGIPTVFDEPLHPELLRSATEVFLTSSIREIVPVASCAQLGFLGSTARPVTTQIRSSFHEMISCNS